jgi:hypothetical protein
MEPSAFKQTGRSSGLGGVQGATGIQKSERGDRIMTVEFLGDSG